MFNKYFLAKSCKSLEFALIVGNTRITYQKKNNNWYIDAIRQDLSKFHVSQIS